MFYSPIRLYEHILIFKIDIQRKVVKENFSVANFGVHPHARMGTAEDENKDLTDFSLCLSASARDKFFFPQRR